MSDLKILETPPNEHKLKSLLLAEQGDGEMINLCLMLIKKFKLPYIVIDNQLRSAFTQGEQYLNRFITVDPTMIEMKIDAVKASKVPDEVLVYGHTGTGKEIVSKSMIGNRSGDIKSVNCAGFPRELIESELFGHMAGSFTGANKTTEGLISLANDGVMFMDEIGELPLDVQAKLLRVLQDRTIRKVGGKIEEKVSCKFVFATNRDLKQMVKEKLFREDLFARVSTLEIDLTNLKERMCDVVPIAESLEGGKEFLAKYGDMLTEGALDLSLNVRSIQQYVTRYRVWGRLKIERP